MSTLTNPSGVYGQMLGDSISKVRARALNFGMASAACWGTAALILTIVACAAVDLVIELGSGVRLACVGGAALVASVIFYILAKRAFGSRATPVVARKLDQLTNSRGQISTGVDLAEATQQKPLTAALATLAVRQASEILSGASLALAVPKSLLTLPVAVLGWIVLAITIVAVASPRLVATQFMRFVDPFGDHPAYSSISLAVNPGNASIVYGGSIDISISVSGGTVEKMDLVLVAHGNTAEEVLPMFPSETGKWQATIAGINTPETYFIRSGRTRSKRFDISLITIPKLEDVKFRVQLPDYTNRPPYDGPVPQNGIAALAGTTVEISAKSNRPLSGGTITLTSDKDVVTGVVTKVSMSPTTAGDSQVTGRFVIQSGGTLSVGVTDIDGQASAETLNTSITLLKDEKPFVRLVSPKPESFATPDVVLKVEALAEDDFGVAAVSIHVGVNGGAMKSIDIPPLAKPATQWPAMLDLPLSDLAVKAGDEVQLYARATDNDPAGGKSSDSSVVTLKIVSQKEMDQMMITKAGMETLQNKYSAAERRLEAADAELAKLEKKLEAETPQSPLSADAKKQIDAEAKELTKAAAEINKLANHPLPFDLDHALQAQLKEAAEAAKKAAEETKSADAMPSAAGALDKVKKAREALGKEKKQFDDEATAPLEHLAKIMPLIEDQAKFLELNARQKDLADRLASAESLTNKDDPKQKAQMRDFEDEQRTIQQELKKLLDDIDSHVAELPDDPRLNDLRDTATKFVDAVRPSPVDAQMSDSESALDDFDGPAAHAAAAEASTTLDQFVGRCQSMGDKFSACLKFQPKLSAGLGNTVQQMLKSMSLSTGKGGGGIGGFSASRSSLANVGLYGTIPLHGRESHGGGGDADLGSSSNSPGSSNGSKSPDFGGFNAKQHASGGNDAPVPAEYKKRVGEYFQRVSDELSK